MIDSQNWTVNLLRVCLFQQSWPERVGVLRLKKRKFTVYSRKTIVHEHFLPLSAPPDSKSKYAVVRFSERLIGWHNSIKQSFRQIQNTQARHEPPVTHFSLRNVEVCVRLVNERRLRVELVWPLPLKCERRCLVIENRCLDGGKFGVLPQLTFPLALTLNPIVRWRHFPQNIQILFVQLKPLGRCRCSQVRRLITHFNHALHTKETTIKF